MERFGSFLFTFGCILAGLDPPVVTGRPTDDSLRGSRTNRPAEFPDVSPVTQFM